MITTTASQRSRLDDDLDPTHPVEVFTCDGAEPGVVTAECSRTQRAIKIKSSDHRIWRIRGTGINFIGDVAHAPAAATSRVIDLLVRTSDGGPTAWAAVIVRRYSKHVFSKVRSFRLQDADAHDAVQATWLRLAENWHRVQDPEHLGGWLATVARRECLQIFRQAKHVPTPPDVAAANVADPSVDPEQHVIDADAAHAVRNLVAELPPRQQALLRELFTDNPRPYAEVAHIIGLPIAASDQPARGHYSSSGGRPTSADSDWQSDYDDSERLKSATVTAKTVTG